MAPYKLTNQLRNTKQAIQSERSIIKEISNVSGMTFHGKLEPPLHIILSPIRKD